MLSIFYYLFVADAFVFFLFLFLKILFDAFIFPSLPNDHVRSCTWVASALLLPPYLKLVKLVADGFVSLPVICFVSSLKFFFLFKVR